MKLSKLISELERKKKKYGDIEVKMGRVSQDEEITVVELEKHEEEFYIIVW